MKIIAGEQINFLAFENELVATVKCLKDCDLKLLEPEYKRDNHWNPNNVMGFATWLCKQGYFLEVNTRSILLGDSYINVQEIE